MKIPGARYAKTPDLPAWFLGDLASIAGTLFVVQHPYRVTWDDLMNFDTGATEDPRFNIHKEDGEVVFGWILRDHEGRPIPDWSYHIWDYRWPHGFTHVFKLADRNPEYLNKILDNLYWQATTKDKYGAFQMNKLMRQKQIEKMEALEKAERETFRDIQQENSWLLKRVMENLERGVYLATDPTKDIITSYGGQKNRSRIIRPLTDEEGGLVAK